MLVSGLQSGDSVIHIHVSVLFQILVPFRLLHNIEQSSLCIEFIFFFGPHILRRGIKPVSSALEAQSLNH